MRQTTVFLGITAAALILFAAAILGWQLHQASAQEVTDTTMSRLLGDLWTQVLAGQTSETSSEFTFTLVFQQSISGLGSSITFGQDLRNARVESIGEDHICVARVFTQTRNIDCIPFSNVVQISYRAEQP